MALLNVPIRPPCVRQFFGGAFQQIRGKKRLAKASTIPVRLLKDVPKFGQAGSLVPAPRGRMRQLWYAESPAFKIIFARYTAPREYARQLELTQRVRRYPQKIADYVLFPELKKLPRGETPQRDFFFQADKPQKKRSKADVTLLSPTQSIQILESFIPPAIQFSSVTISSTETAIHGSISTSDIATAIRMVAAANGERGSRVVINSDNIEFADQSAVEGDKIKAIGEYDFEIRMKGTTDFIRRKAIVMRSDIQA